MTGRKKFILSIIIIALIFVLFIVIQIVKISTQKAKRTSASLLNQYYHLVGRDPENAKRALELMLLQDKNNPIALRALAFWYLRQGDTNSALKQFMLAHERHPDDAIVNKELDLLYATLGKKTYYSSEPVLAPASPVSHKESAFSMAMRHIFDNYAKICYYFKKESVMIKPAVVSASSAQQTTTPERDKLLNEFYDNRVKNPRKAWTAINQLLRRYPNDLVALKEAGYYALSQKKNALSVGYFERAYYVSHDPKLALQLGYILDGLDRKRQAYGYFDLATAATDPAERMKAEIAKTNLRGMQTRFLSSPYFINMLFYPFYQSRFKLLIYPIIAKAGIVLNSTYNISAYVIYRRTSDNKSKGSGVLPQIYEDNAAITSLGIQATPFTKFPLTGFIEAGKSVDLVYKHRARWRNDFRMGFIFYNDWGREARYTFSPHFTLTPNADIYGDLIYYSRYLNTIGTLRVRPGVEIFRYGSTSINFYVKGFLSQDNSRLFYNNIFEVGPGLAFTPCDRYNVTIRYENLKGYYLPAGGQGRNPYSKNYHNSMIFLDTYIGI